MRRLYVSNNAIKKYGYNHFRNFTFNNYCDIADKKLKELEDGLLIIANSEINDPNKDIFIFIDETDINFATYDDIEDIRLKIELSYHSQFFNMKKICELASINYQTYRNWKNSYKPFNDDKIKKLLNAMINTTKDIEESLISLSSKTVDSKNGPIVVGNKYFFSELCNGDEPLDELIDSGSIAVWDERLDNEVIVEFKVIEKNNDNLLRTLIKITDIF